MSVLGVDVGSARLHIARVQRGRAVAVRATDGQAHIPSVVAWGRGRPLVGSVARSHFLISPKDVLFGPARHLGGSAVNLGETSYSPEELFSWLLKEAVDAGQAASGDAIEGVALSRAAWASPEARQALDKAVTLAGVKPLGTRVSTTLAAAAHLIERAITGTVAVVDAGGWKVEAAFITLAPGQVKALGRSVDATIGGSWLDGQLVRAMAHSAAPDHERQILKNRTCYALLREQCENARISLSTLPAVDVSMPFLAPLIGVPGAPVARLDRPLVESVARPLFEAIETVCHEAAAQARLDLTQVTEVLLVGGLARMPALRAQVAKLFNREPHKGGDVESTVARGAALLAAAAVGEIRLEIIDELEQPGEVAVGAGWGQPVPPFSFTPTPELVEAVPQVVGAEVTTRNLAATSAEVELPPDQRPTPATGSAPAHEAPIITPPPDLLDDAPASPEHSPHKATPVAHAHPATPTHAAPVPSAHATPVHSAPSARDENLPGLEPERPLAPSVPAAPLPSEGAFKNPRTAQGLASLSLSGTLQLQPPLPIPVLLLAIGRRRHLSGTLKLTYRSTHTSIAILHGGVGGSPLEMEQLRRSFEWPEGQYKITGDTPMRQNIKRIPVVSDGDGVVRFLPQPSRFEAQFHSCS